MHNLGDDNELDHVSREAAGRYDAPGNANWQKMEAQLDTVLPVDNKRRFGWVWLLLPALLVGGAGYWLLQRENSHTQSLAKNNPAHSIEKINATQNPADKTVSIPAENTARPGATAVLQEPMNNPATQLSVPAQTTTGNKKRNQKVSLSTRHFPDPRASSTGQLKIESPAPAAKSVQQAPAANAIVTQPQPTGEAQSQPAAAAKTAETVKTAVVKEETAIQETSGEAVIAESVFGKPKAFPDFEKGFSVAVIAGADKSTVKFRYNYDPGFNLGVKLGYHLNKRWSVYTGAIYTQKNYKLAGEDFTAPKGSWVSYYKLENVQGYCRMWDVPLLLRYDFSNRGRNSYFISSGLSSYFMTSERYNYFFYNQGMPVTRNASYLSSETHIFSVLHLSGGFENRVTKNLSLLIEPYAKIPMGGVGLGNIQLSSFGINFGLQLRQTKKQ